MITHVGVAVAAAAIGVLFACASPADKSEAAANTMGAAAGTLAEPNIAEIRSTIESANQRAAAALLASDYTGVGANYADDAIVMWSGEPMLRGRLEHERSMKETFTANTLSAATFSIADVQASGDLVVETGNYSMTMTAKGGKPVTDIGKYLTIWKRQPDGSLKIIRDISNSDAPPPAK